jgi:hypothetical protein
VTGVAPDTGSLRNAVRALEQARRDNRRRQLDVWDAIYQAYLVGFSVLAVLALASAVLPAETVSDPTLAWIAERGPAAIGLVISAAVAVALRSGARGGPLVFDPPTVYHVLQSPVDRPFVTRRVAADQLRSGLAWGAVAGATAGLAASASLPGSTFGTAAGFAAAGSATAAAAIGSGLVASGRRWSLSVATIAGVSLVAWSVLDLAMGAHTAPATNLGTLAVWDLASTPGIVVPLLLLALVVSAGMAVCGGVSIEASRRRAGLVSQVRFALTMQDLRMVVLLRRRIAQSGQRRTPWLRIGRSAGTRAPYLRRSIQSHVRLPGSSLLGLVALIVSSAALFVVAARGIAPVALGSPLLLLVAAHMLLEPLAQEADHPTAWEAHPARAGTVVTRLTASAVGPMVLAGLLTGLLAAAASGEGVALVVFPLGAVGALAGAAVSTMMGASPLAVNPLQSEVFGLLLVMRIGVPLLPALLPFVPVTVALANDGGAGAITAPTSMLTLLACGLAWLWLGSRRPTLG